MLVLLFGLVDINLVNVAYIRYGSLPLCGYLPFLRCIFGNGIVLFGYFLWLTFWHFLHEFISKFMAFQLHFALCVYMYVAYFVYISQGSNTICVTKIQGVFKEILPKIEDQFFRNSITLKLNRVQKRYFRSNSCMRSVT